MKQNNILLFLVSFAIMIGMAACALPGQAPQSPSDTDVILVQTTIAGTVRAAATETAIAQPAETKAPGGRTGTAVEKLEDGTTRYIDYDAGFEVTFPAGWLAVRPKSEEFNAALEGEAASNSMLHDTMISDQTEYDEYDRLFSYILRPDLEVKDVMFGFSNLSWKLDDSTPLDSSTLGKLVRGLESATSGISGFRADTVQLHEGGDIKMGEIGGHFMLGDGQGEPIPFYTTIIFFKPTAESIVRMNMTYIEDYHAQIAPDVLSIMDSIKPIEP